MEKKRLTLVTQEVMILLEFFKLFMFLAKAYRVYIVSFLNSFYLFYKFSETFNKRFEFQKSKFSFIFGTLFCTTT